MNRHIKRGLLTLVLILAGCVPLAATPTPPSVPTTAPPSAPPPAGGSTNLENTQWQLVSFGAADSPTPIVEGSKITLTFQSNGIVGGSSGCNEYGGKYEIKENVLTFSDLNSTLRACLDERLNRQEQAYLEALQTASAFDLAEDRLTITYDNGQQVLNFVRAV